jgi:hypothetical protein
VEPVEEDQMSTFVIQDVKIVKAEVTGMIDPIQDVVPDQETEIDQESVVAGVHGPKTENVLEDPSPDHGTEIVKRSGLAQETANDVALVHREPKGEGIVETETVLVGKMVELLGKWKLKPSRRKRLTMMSIDIRVSRLSPKTVNHLDLLTMEDMLMMITRRQLNPSISAIGLVVFAHRFAVSSAC